HPMGLAFGYGPCGPTDQPVNRVAALRLVQREPMVPPIDFVAATVQPVRPRDQHLTASRRTHLVGRIPVNDFPTARRVAAQPATDLDDNGLLVPGRYRYLLSGWRDHPRPLV